MSNMIGSKHKFEKFRNMYYRKKKNPTKNFDFQK